MCLGEILWNEGGESMPQKKLFQQYVRRTKTRAIPPFGEKLAFVFSRQDLTDRAEGLQDDIKEANRQLLDSKHADIIPNVETSPRGRGHPPGLKDTTAASSKSDRRRRRPAKATNQENSGSDQ